MRTLISCCLFLALGAVPWQAANAREALDLAAVEALLAQTRQQLDQVRQYASGLVGQLKGLKATLEAADSRNQAQARRIAELEQMLADLQLANPGGRRTLEIVFFSQLDEALGPSPVAVTGDDHVNISSDQVFVFGTGELGAEGRRRLEPLGKALHEAITLLPDREGWRLRVEGHTDSRPLKNSARFPSNWELSSARAVAVLRYLKELGLPEQRLVAAGYAASRQLDQGESKAAHRRNRRVEIRLEFDVPVQGHPLSQQAAAPAD